MIIITVFTKDRLDRSERTFSHWKNSPYPVVVVDDSYFETNRSGNLALAHENGLVYHGPCEQKKFFSQIDIPELLGFTGRLGNGSWNLGNNRNYALNLAIATGHKFVIFSDDDVIVDRNTLLQVGMQLQFRPFVGAQISGMPDHSIIGHLYRQAGRIIQPQYTSGTFLGVDCTAVNLPFPNCYNEDWIWLCLENQGRHIEQTFSVEQLYYDPFSDWKEKIFFQEEGEILWEGIYLSTLKFCTIELSSVAFWREVIKRRRSQIERLSSLLFPKTTNKLAHEIQGILLNHLDSLDSQYFAHIMNMYLRSKKDWHKLYEEVKNIGSTTHKQAVLRQSAFALR